MTSRGFSGAAALVTGAAGFLGRRLVRRLLARGCPVVALDAAEGGADEQSAQGLIRVRGGIDSPAALGLALEGLRRLERPQAVLFHLAALSHVGACEHDPEGAHRLNCEAALALAGWWAGQGYRRVLFPSTALVYANRGLGPLSEDASVAAANAYGASKLAAERGLCRLAEDRGLRVDIVRLSNVYGGRGAAPDTVVSEALRQGLAGRAPRMRRPRVVLDFLYCEDAAEGMVRVAEAEGGPGCRILNLSTGAGRTVAEMAGLVRRLCGLAEPCPDGAEGEGEGLVLDNSRLRALTGWVPQFDLAAGLAHALAELKGDGPA